MGQYLGSIPPNKTNWTSEMLDYLKNNFYSKTNQQLADGLGLKLTTVRSKCLEMGMKRMEMEYWTEEQVEFLKNNYTTKGDTELAEIFQQCWPKNKLWTIKHIEKKRKYMKLIRTAEQISKIREQHYLPGGACNTIMKNSCSVNLTDGYVANCISWRNKELSKELLKHPDLLQVKRTQLILKRKIKMHEKQII